MALVRVDDGESAGDGFAEIVSELLLVSVRQDMGDAVVVGRTFSSVLMRHHLQSSGRGVGLARLSDRRVAS